MQSYSRAKFMSQFYRDVFSRKFTISNTGTIPEDVLKSIFIELSTDLIAINKKLNACDTSLPVEEEKALKQLLLTAVMANLGIDKKWSGKQVRLPEDYIENIRNSLLEVLDINPTVEYLVVVIQLLYRIGDIDISLELINNNLEILKNEPTIYWILLMTYMIEEDYNLALPLITEMTENPYLIDDNWFVLLLITCAIYKLGGVPDSYIDFRSLLNKNQFSSNYDYRWITDRNHDNTKTTIVVAFDTKYYYEHAIPALYSIFDTNKNNYNVHFHIYNIDDGLAADILKKKNKFPELNITCTTEYFSNVDKLNGHYATRRFIFAQYALSELSTPLLIIDADCLFRKNIANLMEQFSGHDVILTQNENSPFWEAALAGFVYLGGGITSRHFIDEVAAFIDTNLQSDNIIWFLDQIALSVALDHAKDLAAVARVDSGFVCDVNHEDHSFIWMVTTEKNAKGRYASYKDQLVMKYEEKKL